MYIANKTSASDLAILGGTPAFVEPLHVGRPNIGDRQRLIARINDLLDRRWLTNDGPYVREFEQAVAARLGVRHCIAMSNGTVALEIAIRGLGLSGEVIVPSYTFVATAHALQWQEITPVFCDIDPVSHTIDPRQVERLITPRTSGVIGVHLWGRPCDTTALESVARRRNLTLMYDASHAFGCSHDGRMIGSFGRAEVFSFHATKMLNTFEGGAIVTNDDVLAGRVKLMRNFGFAGFDNVIYLGTNGKMSEVSAAMGLTGLESMDDFIAVNRRNYLRYVEEFQDIPGIRIFSHDESEKRNFQYVVAEVDESESACSRDLLIQALHAENVIARRYFYPGCHRMEPYRSYFPHAGLLLPETERVAARVIVLPTGTAVSPDDVATICGIIRCAARHGRELTERLAKAA